MRKRLYFNRKSVSKLSTLVLAGILTVSAVFIQNPVSSYAENSAAGGEQNVRTEIPGTVSTESEYNDSFLSVTGFASGNVHDRSEYVGTEYYRVITDEKEFLDAIRDAQSGKVKVMEITKDMDLGYKYLTELLTSSVLKNYTFVREYKKPSNDLTNVNGGFTNPLMEKSGVTTITVGNIDGLTIFSPNASSIKHTELKITGNDIVIRNLHFKEMWQWDDAGAQKEVGWSNLKINGGKNVWVDHCTFEIASDGNIDLENGATGITISWCKIGDEALENPSEDGSIYQSIMFMEDRYQKGELKPATSLYYKMRTGGATPEQIMAYSAYHKKCHLSGSGDKDFVNYVRGDGTVVEDANSNIKLTLAYNHYVNVGQRVPMIRQGVGNLINCYIDDSTHQTAAAANPIFKQVGPYSLSRCLNARNGACIAADTCVFNGIEEPIVGAEVQGDDTGNMTAVWAKMFKNVYNHTLIVNSTVTNSKGTYTGSSWDNNGNNLFTTGFKYRDKSTVGKWAWASHIVNESSYEKRDYTIDEAAPMEFTYDEDGTLPFEYQVLPLEDVKEVVTGKSGSGVIEMTSTEWLQTQYSTDADYSAVDAAIKKANALNPSDYADFSGVTAAINAVERGLKSDSQAKVDAMAEAIENAINALVKPEENKNGFYEENGAKYWYENGILQGLEGRGKEIYDPSSDAWYWLDSIQGGAVAKSKDVYQESWAGSYGDNGEYGKWVRYDADGHMIKGWDTNEDGTYYFEPVTGAMAKGTVNIDGTNYRFDSVTGILLNNVFVWENGNQYWYENGILQGTEGRGKEIYDPATDAWYWLDAIDGGKKATSKDVYQESYAGQYADRLDGTGKWVRYDENGKMIKGWNWSEEKQGTYYFDPVTGAMAKGNAEIDGIKYVFDSATGKLVVENQVAENGRLYALEAEQEAKYGKGNPFHVQALKEETDKYAKFVNEHPVVTVPELEALGLLEYLDGFYRSATFEQDGKTYLEEVYTEGGFRYKILGVATSHDSEDYTDYYVGDLARCIENMTEGTVYDFEYIVFDYTYDSDTDMTILSCELFTINVKPQ